MKKEPQSIQNTRINKTSLSVDELILLLRVYSVSYRVLFIPVETHLMPDDIGGEHGEIIHILELVIKRSSRRYNTRVRVHREAIQLI